MKHSMEKEVIIDFVDAIINIRQAIKHHFQMKINSIEGLEISYEMFQVLTVLWNKNLVNQQEIANATQKGKASLTPLIDNLAKINLVTRTEDPVDRRNKIIALTAEGKQYKKKFEPIYAEFYDLMQGNMPNKKVTELTGILLTMRNKI